MRDGAESFRHALDAIAMRHPDRARSRGYLFQYIRGVIDQQFGRFINHSLGEYHVPVNADIHDIDVIFVEEHDEVVNPIGAKGLGEIGVVGVAAAIANAVFHATGKRIRELPITLDKVM